MTATGDAPASVACDSACFAAFGVSAGTYHVRDVWDALKVVATVSPPYSFAAAVPAAGSAALFRISPASAP